LTFGVKRDYFESRIGSHYPRSQHFKVPATATVTVHKLRDVLYPQMHREFVARSTGLGDAKNHITPPKYVADVDIVFGGADNSQILAKGARFVADTQLMCPTSQVNKRVSIYGLELPAMHTLAADYPRVSLFVTDNTSGVTVTRRAVKSCFLILENTSLPRR
jgi:hypothetical protein